MLRPVAALPLVLLACSPEGPDLPPLELESGRAVIGIDEEFDITLCRGDLAYIDAQLERAEAQLGVRRSTPVTIYLVASSIIEELCGSDTNACYRHSEGTIYSNWQSMGHELVHAAADGLEFPSLFWDEGAAELLSNGTFRDDRITLEPADLEADTLTTYRSAGHFSRFLVETHGWDAYRRTIRGESLEDVVGQSAAELTAEYERDAPYAHPPLDPCPYPRIPQVDETHWHARLDFSCDSADATEFEAMVTSRSSGAAVYRAVELEAGVYDLQLTGGDAMFAIACHTEELSVAPTAPSNGDLYNENDLAAALGFESGELHRLELTDGTYLLSVSSGTYDRASAEVSITRVQ